MGEHQSTGTRRVKASLGAGSAVKERPAVPQLGHLGSREGWAPGLKGCGVSFLKSFFCLEIQCFKACIKQHLDS